MFVLAFIGTLVGLLIPYINEQVYDLFIPLGDSLGVIQICSVVLACTIGNISFSVVKNLAQFRSVNAMKYNLQCATYDRLYNMPQSFFRKYDSALASLSAMGVSSIFQTISDSVVTGGIAALFSLLYLWRMFRYSPTMAWISILMVAIGGAVIVLLGYRQIKYEKAKLLADGDISSLMYQQISGISKIRTAGVEDRALYEYIKPYSESRRLDMMVENFTGWVEVVTIALPTIFSMVLYYIMVVNSLNLSVGEFVGFTSAFGAFSAAMLNLANSYLSVNNVRPLYDIMKDFLTMAPETDPDSVLPGEITGDIELNHVSFSYDEKMGQVIKDLSLHVQAGEYIGIVGSSGCGKSTLLKLLLGFEKPLSGKIYYDGKDIDSMDKRELQKKFGVVLQDGGLVAGSIMDNITIACPDVRLKRVKEVVRQVGLEEDIQSMPMGLYTTISEGAGTISGGQKQRILIARAIIGSPKILFFDEATSALDNVTQMRISESLEGLNATRVIIAHRLSTVMKCDRILVMEEGRIAEEGTYEELMAKGGLFSKLASRQLA